MTNTIWSITQLVGYVKNKLTFDSNLRNVKVQGELGNFSSYRGSGHWYFTLKDAGASIKCAMFKGYNNAVEFNPEEGDTVIVTGTVNVYENRGELQLVVTEMKLAGQGMFSGSYASVSPNGDGRRLMDKELGWFHACSAYPVSDLTIRIPIL